MTDAECEDRGYSYNFSTLTLNASPGVLYKGDDNMYQVIPSEHSLKIVDLQCRFETPILAAKAIEKQLPRTFIQIFHPTTKGGNRDVYIGGEVIAHIVEVD